MQTTMEEGLTRAWGVLFESRAIAYQVARTGHTAIQLPGFARADALLIPSGPTTSQGIRLIGCGPRPYWFEAKARRKPLLLAKDAEGAKEPRIYLPAKVHADLVDLWRITKLKVKWLVVAPDVVLSCTFPDVAPAGIPFDGNDVYFTLDQFDRDPEGAAFFEEVFA